jgi:DNA invertase Pin-like site-specific DNA recombinase
LTAAGCAKVYQEKISGAKTDRAELGRVLKHLHAGDVLVVTRLDRLARSTRDLLNILDAIGKLGYEGGRTARKPRWIKSGSCPQWYGRPHL